MKGIVTINPALCKGCGLCVATCPKQVLRQDDGLNSRGYHPAAVAQPQACIACGMCAIICPDSVITVEKED